MRGLPVRTVRPQKQGLGGEGGIGNATVYRELGMRGDTREPVQADGAIRATCTGGRSGDGARGGGAGAGRGKRTAPASEGYGEGSAAAGAVLDSKNGTRGPRASPRARVGDHPRDGTEGEGEAGNEDAMLNGAHFAASKYKLVGGVSDGELTQRPAA